MQTKLVTLVVVGSLLFTAMASVSGAQETPSDARFFEAFYLETEQRDCEAAAKLYEQVAADERATAELRAKAALRLAGCREELAGRDLAALMPEDTLAYVELNRPGERVVDFLAELGLAAGVDRPSRSDGPRLAISPALIRGVLGIGGAAAAVTGFDPARNAPSGIVVIHPGDLEVVRGLLETGLPIAASPVEPIHGFPTYSIEGQAVVTLTLRLAVAATDRKLVEGVLDRLVGEQRRSLGSSRAFTLAMGDRKKSMLLLFVNAQPVVPMVKGMMAANQSTTKELAMMDQLLDLDSLESFAAQLDLGAEGLTFTSVLRLAEGHRNLPFHLLRTPSIQRETLRLVPDDAAAVLAIGLNAPGTNVTNNLRADSSPLPPVTLLDIGREVFANIRTVAAFAVPPIDGATGGGAPVPDVGLVMTVNDPARSEALWTTLLGLAGMGCKAAPIEGESVEIEGVRARTFTFCGGVTVSVATLGGNVIVSPSRAALSRVIQSGRTGRSILEDRAFSALLEGAEGEVCQLLYVHAGRAAEIARRYVPARELAEAEPFLQLLDGTAASVLTEHSETTLRVSAKLTGLPDVSGVVDKMIARRLHDNVGNTAGKARRTADVSEEKGALDGEASAATAESNR